MTRPMTISYKMAEQLAERAKRLDGCVKLGGTSEIYEFANGSTVTTIIGLINPVGHMMRNPARAAEIRAEIARRDKVAEA